MPGKTRRTNHRVRVRGKVHRSTKKAFEELGLPIRDHVRFRNRLKEHSSGIYIHNNEEYKFFLVNEENDK